MRHNMQPTGTADPSASPRFAGTGTASQSIASDILRGAGEIAEFIYGTKTARRTVYHLIEHNRIPHFRIGTGVCARKSVLVAWIQAQESAALAASHSPTRG